MSESASPVRDFLRLSILPVLIFALPTLAAAASDRSAEKSADIVSSELVAGYNSPAGAVLGTYKPTRSNHAPESMANAANRFLYALNDEQRRIAQHPLTSPERTAWTNAPARGKVGGIALGDLNESQLHALSDLLASLLSKQGYQKIRDVMLGDDLRAIVDGKVNTGVGIAAFRFVVFGDPSASSRWAVQLDGHHIALNITLDGEAYSMSPSFIGTFPQEFTVAGVSMRPMAGETDLAHAFISSLTREQRDAAVVSNRRGTLRVGPGKDGIVPKPLGIRCHSLDKTQRALLISLASQWFDIMPPDHASTRKARFVEMLDQTWFSWRGPVSTGNDVSYAIQSPAIIIEYASNERGGSDGSNPVDHVHSIYRDLMNEYGRRPDSHKH